MIGKFEVKKASINEWKDTKYQQLTLLEKSSHMLEQFPSLSVREQDAPIPTSEIVGKVIMVTIDKIEIFNNAPRFKGTYELATKENSTPQPPKK